MSFTSDNFDEDDKQYQSGFIDKKEIASLEAKDKEVKEKIKTLPKESQEAIAIVNQTFDEMNNDVFDFESEARVRQAGYTPQQAEDIEKIVKRKQVGEIFEFNKQQLVLTPFQTVVPAQTYVQALQDRVLQLTTVPAEVEISNLKAKINGFTSLSFFGLIKLAFKRLTKTEKING